MSDQITPLIGFQVITLGIIYAVISMVWQGQDRLGIGVSVAIVLVGIWIYLHPKPWYHDAEIRVQAIRDWEDAGCPDLSEYLGGKYK